MRKLFLMIFILLMIPANAQDRVSTGRLDVLKEGADAGFLRAINPRDFDFPADHGPHPGYRHEWWYLTGNLENNEGRKFGYQLTFFRFALAPGEDSLNGSKWRTNVAFAAHFAITDVDEDNFIFFQRYSRGDGRLAGANVTKVWLDDWVLVMDDDQWQISVSEGDLALNLSLKQIKPVLLNGDAGLSRKSEIPGNASYYYAITRMEGSGMLRIGDEQYTLSGLTWLDREWGTSALSADQQGWDWFALHLSDGSDLMFYNLRNEDGSRHPYSAGSWVDRNGIKTALEDDDVEIETIGIWESPLGGTYPSGWKIYIKNKGLELEVAPMIKSQELNVTPRYWEGAVTVTGTRNSTPINGSGYVELTGYAK